MKKTTVPTWQAIGVLGLNVFLGFMVLAGTSTDVATINGVNGKVERTLAEVVVTKSQETMPEDPAVKKNPIAEIETTLKTSFGLNETRAAKFARWVHEAHEKTGVPVGYMVALVATESSFRYQVVSHAGAIGPAQVIPKFWQEWCDADLTDPQQNILCGAKVLAHYRTRCVDWSCAFKKYNVGPTGYRQAQYIGAMKRYMTKIDRNLKIAGDFDFLKQG